MKDSMKDRTTNSLISCIMQDVFPPIFVCAYFGIKSQEDYDAYYYPIRAGELNADNLTSVVGKGNELTNLLRSVKSNPHKDIIIETPWDNLPCPQ